MRYCIGDVHACSHELKLLIDLILNRDPEARLYSVGDLVNKGPDGLGVLELVQEFQIQAIRGNHEDWLLRVWQLFLDALKLWIDREGLDPFESFEFAGLEQFIFHDGFCEFFLTQKGPRAKDVDFLRSFRGLLHLHINSIESLPYWLDLGEVLMVHAGVVPDETQLEEMNPRVMTTIRTWDGKGSDLKKVSNPAWFDLVSWPKPIVFGHWAQKGLVDQPRFKGLDTGCVYGKKLTAWCIESGEFHEVQAQKIYCPI